MGALEGIRVLDLSRYAPGLFVGMMLGDMGAEVIKIDEPPPKQSSELSAPPMQVPERRVGRNHPAYAPNRNKQSIVLNLKSEGGRTAFLRLADTADVVLEGFRPGVVNRLGIDYSVLDARNPRLVYCSLSGYGQTGPYRLLTGHDANYISIAGALGITGLEFGPPILPGFLLADFAGGAMFALAGTLLALLARERTGRGQYVDVAMADSVLQLLTTEFSSYLALGVKPERGRYWLSGAAPYYAVYECADGGFVTIAAVEPAFWANLCNVLGTPQYLDMQNERARWPEMRAALAAIFRTRTRDEWFALLREKDVCVAPVYGFEEVVKDPQLRHRDMLLSLPSAEPMIAPDPVVQVGFAIKLSDTPARARSLAPRVGQHTDQILEDLGYSPGEISSLREAGATF